MKTLQTIGIAAATALLTAFLYQRLCVAPVLARTVSLQKRAQILEQEIGKLDRRIKRQEHLKHGFGF